MVAGTGLAAIRDVISFLRYENKGTVLLGDQSRHMKRALAFGTSQSGRLLRQYLYDGFNRDEKDRKVFDGVWANVGGAGRGSFNIRGAQPSQNIYNVGLGLTFLSNEKLSISGNYDYQGTDSSDGHVGYLRVKYKF